MKTDKKAYRERYNKEVSPEVLKAYYRAAPVRKLIKAMMAEKAKKATLNNSDPTD